MALFIRFLLFSSFVSFLNTYTCWARLPASSPFHRRVAKSHAWALRGLTWQETRERGESFVRSSGEVLKPTNLTPFSEIRLICSSNKGKNTFLEKEVIDSLQSRKFGSLSPLEDRDGAQQGHFLRGSYMTCCCYDQKWWKLTAGDKQRTGNFTLDSKLKKKDVALIVMSRSWDKKINPLKWFDGLV